jgi:hypothetical protein
MTPGFETEMTLLILLSMNKSICDICDFQMGKEKGFWRTIKSDRFALENGSR